MLRTNASKHILLTSLLAVVTESANILAIFPLDLWSHWMVVEPLLLELTVRGHDVTVFSHFPPKARVPNYTHFHLSNPAQEKKSGDNLNRLKALSGMLAGMSLCYEVHEKTCKIMHDIDFQRQILHSKTKYDLFMTELFASDCFAYFSHRLKVPLITFTTTNFRPWATERTGLPDNPSYIANIYSPLGSPKNLYQRIINTFFSVYSKYLHLWIYAKQTEEAVLNKFGGKFPAIQDVVANTSLVLVNSHPAVFQARPLTPNVVEVAGIHIRERQTLPQDVQEIVDSAEHGVVIMSFGSLISSSSLLKPVVMMFLRSFSKIPQVVIMKFDHDIPEAPSNVFVRKWLPQRDLLEHEKVRALITHGGLASTIEAVNFGKPLIGIPFFGDQHGNVATIVAKGAGLRIDLKEISEEMISHALQEVLYNPKFSYNMNELSLQFRDRPLGALQTAVFWVEYVVRHQGAPFLKPESTNLSFYQYYLLDVAIFYCIIVYLICMVLKQCLSILIRKNRKEGKIF